MTHIEPGSPDALAQRQAAVSANQQLWITNDRRAAEDLLNPGQDEDVPAWVHGDPDGTVAQVSEIRTFAGRKLAAGVLALGGLAMFVACGDSDERTANSIRQGVGVTETQSPETNKDACEVKVGTWTMEEVKPNEKHRWFLDGIKEIKDAETDEEAKAAADVWLDKVKRHDTLLAGAHSFLTEQELEVDSLKDADGCATTQASAAVTRLELALATARSITVADAPADAYNSGIDDKGGVVVNKERGVSDDPGTPGKRKAIRAELDDGTVVFIMARCGQVVVMVPPTHIPKGPTEEPKRPKQPERPTPKLTPKPVPTPTTTPKVVTPKKDDGKLPQNPEDGAAGQDKGTPSLGGEGKGPSGQTPDEFGYVPGEQRPATPPRNDSGSGGIGVQEPSSVTEGRPPALTGEDGGSNQPSTTVPGSSNDDNYNQGGYTDPNSI